MIDNKCNLFTKCLQHSRSTSSGALCRDADQEEICKL